jgi:Family of unknown function (DUF6444)
VTELEARLVRLERLASRDSGNSSFPPSADDLPGRIPPPQRRGPGPGKKRKPGKQPGAPGSHLAWSQEPGQRAGHFPAGACACGAALASAADLGVVSSHQQVEIPLETATVIQHDLHEVACSCGRGAPLRGADRGTDRRPALGRVRACGDRPRCGGGRGGEQGDPGADHPGARGVRR